MTVPTHEAEPSARVADASDQAQTIAEQRSGVAYYPLPPDGCVLTTAEAAMVLRMPPKTLEWWRRERYGPVPIKIGRYRRYRSEDIKAWLAQQAEAGEGWMAS